MRWTDNIASTGQLSIVYKSVVDRPGGKRPLGKSNRRWDNDIGTDVERRVGAGRLACCRVQRTAFFNTICNFGLHRKWGIYGSALYHLSQSSGGVKIVLHSLMRLHGVIHRNQTYQ